MCLIRRRQRSCLPAPRIAEWVATKIPVEEETKFGQSAFADMKGELKLEAAGPRLDAVTAIGARLTKGSRYSYQFHVVDDKTINAFAIPGGIVVVHTGLIDATRRPEELAGVLAHEVQHVEQRHSIEGLIKQMGLYALWSLATGDLGGTLASRAALELTGLKFSRDAETEADDKGFEALVAANIDPSGMPAFFETMEKENNDLPAAFLSTHPLSRDRRAVLAQRVASFGGRAFEPLSLGPWPPSR
jgi:beta-barrel assembly-enhancing protease